MSRRRGITAPGGAPPQLGNTRSIAGCVPCGLADAAPAHGELGALGGGKAQWIRLADVLLFGPFLIYVARQQRNRYFRAGLAAFGAGTIAFNAVNWWRLREAEGMMGLAATAVPPSGPATTAPAHAPAWVWGAAAAAAAWIMAADQRWQRQRNRRVRRVPKAPRK